MHRLVAALSLAVLGGLFSPLTALAAVPTEPDYRVIDKYVSDQMAGVPGLSLGIVHGDQVTHTRGFGLTTGGGQAVTPGTPFLIGSIAKSFTALATAQLVATGKVDFDAPVQTYLPWFTVSDPKASARITVRHLLNQTSGLPVANPALPLPSMEGRVRELAQTKLNGQPGTRFEYSNDNFVTLGVIIETVSGQSYGDYVRQHIYTPLDMRRSFTSDTEARGADPAKGHTWWFGASVRDDSGNSDFQASGRLISTAEDMAHYMIAQLNGGRYQGRSVVKAELIEEMHQGAGTEAGGGKYAMGWSQIRFHEVDTVQHNGSNFNFHANLIMVPSSGWGVVVLANADSLPAVLAQPVDNIAAGVVDLVSGRAPDFSLSPIGLYAALDLLLGAVIAFQLWSIVRVLRSRRHRGAEGAGQIARRVVWPVLWRLSVAALCVGFVVLEAILFGAPLTDAVATDVGAGFLVVALVFAASGIVRLVHNVRRLGAPNTGPPR
jgi:CubicO group peptidase (beta-lactamase class C family)